MGTEHVRAAWRRQRHKFYPEEDPLGAARQLPALLELGTGYGEKEAQRLKGGFMLLLPMVDAIFRGGAVPIVWIIGIVLMVAGVVSLVRGSLVLGVILIIVGILLGGLNVF